MIYYSIQYTEQHEKDYNKLSYDKTAYKFVVKFYKETSNKEFLLNEVKILFEVQESEDFKKLRVLIIILYEKKVI